MDDDTKSLIDFGIQENDLIEVQEAHDPNDISRIAKEILNRFTSTMPQNSQDTALDNEVRNLYAHVDSNPHYIESIKSTNIELYNAVKARNTDKIKQILIEKHRERKEQEMKRRKLIDELNSDPYNEEKQRMIEEMIYNEQINEQMENVVEYHPETFGSVFMLYIEVEVNKLPIKAFVDTGAQNTIMSRDCAERCGILKFVDKRFSGIAKGVGTSKILGRVHQVMIKIGNSYFANSIMVLENCSVDFILGLDLMKRHQCTIDLASNSFRIGDESTHFLPEKDIPQEEYSSNHNDAIEQTNKNVQTKPNGQDSVSLSDEVIMNLMELGHSREDVIEALRVCEGNAEMAASMLMEGFSMKM